MSPENTEQSIQALMASFTHREITEMYIELSQLMDQMDHQVEEIYIHARSLKMERDSLLARLGEDPDVINPVKIK